MAAGRKAPLYFVLPLANISSQAHYQLNPTATSFRQMRWRNCQSITEIKSNLMMRWFSAVAFMFYLCLLVTPQVASAHAPHLTPLADSQLLAVSPLTGQASLISEQDSGDDNDNSLQLSNTNAPLLFNLAVSSLPGAIALPQPKAAHPVRAPPSASLA